MTKRKPPANGSAKKRMKAEAVSVAADLEILDLNAVEEGLASSGSGANEEDKNKLPSLSESQKEEIAKVKKTLKQAHKDVLQAT